jgi:hypothetical protein
MLETRNAYLEERKAPQAVRSTHPDVRTRNQETGNSDLIQHSVELETRHPEAEARNTHRERHKTHLAARYTRLETRSTDLESATLLSLPQTLQLPRILICGSIMQSRLRIRVTKQHVFLP